MKQLVCKNCGESESLWAEGEVAAWRSILAHEFDDGKIRAEYITSGLSHEVMWDEWHEYKYGCGYCEEEWYPLEKGVVEVFKEPVDIPDPIPGQMEIE